MGGRLEPEREHCKGEHTLRSVKPDPYVKPHPYGNGVVVGSPSCLLHLGDYVHP